MPLFFSGRQGSSNKLFNAYWIYIRYRSTFASTQQLTIRKQNAFHLLILLAQAFIPIFPVGELLSLPGITTLLIKASSQN